MLVVHRRDATVNGAAALEPDASIALGQIAREARNLVQRPVRLFVMAVRTERRDVPMDAIAAQRHAWHMNSD